MVFIVIVFTCEVSFAASRYYHSGNTSPFIRMMLVMMDAMGMLDRVPYGGYGPYGYAGSPYRIAPWNRYQGDSYYRSPWNRTSWSNSPWVSSPWGYTGTGINSPVWGSPDWGVLPVEGYSYNNYAPYSSRWSAEELDDWAREPWELSEWNPLAETRQAGRSQVTDSRQPEVAAPIVQNFNLSVTDQADPVIEQRRQSVPEQAEPHRDVRMPAAENTTASPLARLNQRGAMPGPWSSASPTSQSGMRPPAPDQRKQVSRQSKADTYEKPCVTDFCGLKKPNISGLWVAQDGEMLGIKYDRYLWTDGSTRYLTGEIKLQNEYMLAKVDGYDRVKRFKYKLAGDHLLTMEPGGKIREFIRAPNNFSGIYPSQRFY